MPEGRHDKLKNEMDFKVRPAMAALVESLRVLNLVSAPEYQTATHNLLIPAQNLAESLAAFTRRVERDERGGNQWLS